MKIFTVYDSKAGAYLQPFFERSPAVAVRAIQAILKNPQHPFTLHAEDFTLFQLGQFDEDTGLISISEAKISLGTVLDIRASMPTGLSNVVSM